MFVAIVMLVMSTINIILEVKNMKLGIALVIIGLVFFILNLLNFGVIGAPLSYSVLVVVVPLGLAIWGGVRIWGHFIRRGIEKEKDNENSADR